MRSFIALVLALTSLQEALAGFPCCILRDGEWMSVCKDVECPKGKVPVREDQNENRANDAVRAREAVKFGAHLLRQ